MTDVGIRRAGPQDWPLVRDARLATLRTDPEQFTSRYEDAAAFDDAEWVRRTTAHTWFVAVEEATGRGVGLVRTGAEDGAPTGDRLLASLWVAPEHRGTGLVDRLVDAVRADAGRHGGRRVTLWVKASNARARAAYTRLGFGPLPVPPSLTGHECAGEVRMGLRLHAATDVVVRTVDDPEDWALLRDVRLAALRADPAAFWSTYAQESGSSEADWRERAGRGAVRLALDAASGDVLGMLGTGVEGGAPPGGVHLWGMWVDPAARGRRVARALVDAVADGARADGAQHLSLWVRRANTDARTAYAALGFVEEDPPPGADDYRPHDEVRMVLRPV